MNEYRASNLGFVEDKIVAKYYIWVFLFLLPIVNLYFFTTN